MKYVLETEHRVRAAVSHHRALGIGMHQHHHDATRSIEALQRHVDTGIAKRVFKELRRKIRATRSDVRHVVTRSSECFGHIRRRTPSTHSNA
jgi:hypothetical protein